MYKHQRITDKMKLKLLCMVLVALALDKWSQGGVFALVDKDAQNSPRMF